MWSNYVFTICHESQSWCHLSERNYCRNDNNSHLGIKYCLWWQCVHLIHISFIQMDACLFDPYEYHKDLCNESCLAGLCSKNFNVGHHMQTSQQNFFTSAILMGISWLLPFGLLSQALTLPGGHKVSTKQNLLVLFFPTLFIWSGWNLMWWWSSSSWTYWDYFWVRFIERK